MLLAVLLVITGVCTCNLVSDLSMDHPFGKIVVVSERVSKLSLLLLLLYVSIFIAVAIVVEGVRLE